MFRSFRHRNYKLFFGGQLISLIGTWMQSVAQSWLIYRLTHSSFLLGLTGFMGQFPGFVAAPLGGIVADRHSKHRVMILTQTSSMILAFVLSALTFTDVVQVWHIVLLAGLLGVVNAFDIPARQSFVVEMVGREDLTNAIALNSSMFNGARIAGPAVAGILLAALGEGWCFFLNGVSFLAVIAGLLFMKLPKREKKIHTTSAWEHLAEGFQFVWKTSPIRLLLLQLGVVSLVGMPFTVLMPIFADDILNSGARGLGILTGMTGAGALLATLLLTLKTGVRGFGRWIFLSCLGFGVSLIIFSQLHVFLFASLALIAVGFTMMMQTAATNTLIQTMVPDHFRGRVMSFYSIIFLGLAPFGALFAGILAKPLGAPLTVAIGGFACICVSFLFWRNLPKIRPEAERLLVANGIIFVDEHRH